MELLSLISVGKEFQMCAPSNMKLFSSYLYAAVVSKEYFQHLKVYNLSFK